MKTFKDVEGREWRIIIDVDMIRMVLDTLKINLLDAVDGELIFELSENPLKFCSVLYVLLEEQIKGRSLDEKGFARALGGGDILEHATDAFLEELVDFFPSRKRAVLRKALDKMKTIYQTAMDKVGARVDKMDPEKLLREAQDELAAQEAKSSTGSGGMPEPSGSTQAPEPSAS